MKHLILAAAVALLPAVAMAQGAPAAPAGGAMPMCTAKVQDSCQQGPAQQARALDHYPADKRDAGNNKIGGGADTPAPHKMHKMHKPHATKVRKSIVTHDSTTTDAAK